MTHVALPSKLLNLARALRRKTKNVSLNPSNHRSSNTGATHSDRSEARHVQDRNLQDQSVLKAIHRQLTKEDKMSKNRNWSSNRHPSVPPSRYHFSQTGPWYSSSTTSDAASFPSELYRTLADSIALHACEWDDASERTCSTYAFPLIQSIGVRYVSPHKELRMPFDLLLDALNFTITGPYALFQLPSIPEQDMEEMIRDIVTQCALFANKAPESIKKKLRRKNEEEELPSQKPQDTQRVEESRSLSSDNNTEAIPLLKPPEIETRQELRRMTPRDQFIQDVVRLYDWNSSQNYVSHNCLTRPPYSELVHAIAQNYLLWATRHHAFLHHQCGLQTESEINVLLHLLAPILLYPLLMRESSCLPRSPEELLTTEPLRRSHYPIPESVMKCATRSLSILLVKRTPRTVSDAIRYFSPNTCSQGDRSPPERNKTLKAKRNAMVHEFVFASSKVTAASQDSDTSNCFTLKVSEGVRTLLLMMCTSILQCNAPPTLPNVPLLHLYECTLQEQIRCLVLRQSGAHSFRYIFRSMIESLLIDTVIFATTRRQEFDKMLRRRKRNGHFVLCLQENLLKLFHQSPLYIEQVTRKLAQRVLCVLNQFFLDRLIYTVELCVLPSTVYPQWDVIVITAPSLRVPLDVRYPHAHTPQPWTFGHGPFEHLLVQPSPAPAARGLLATSPPIITSLNYFGSIPYALCPFMKDVLSEVVRRGYPTGKVPHGFSVLRSDMTEDEVEGVRKRAREWMWFKELMFEIHRVTQCESLRRFYLPQKLDFRGRAYPISGVLATSYSDPYRSLFRYADAVPLGSSGLRWLKIHTGNMLDFSRLSFEDRIRRVDESMDQIMEIARDPFALNALMVWQHVDHPFQCIAACKELAQAINYPQGPEAFPSALPVQVDGSANGLQHAAAISRDYDGGAAVNLVPQESPADPYSVVLQEAIRLIHCDAYDSSHECAIKVLGNAYQHDINAKSARSPSLLTAEHVYRKTIKQSVMTQVYGVTRYGMIHQIQKQLEDQNQHHCMWSPKEVRSLAQYLAEKVDLSIGKVFHNAQVTRQWVQNLAEHVLTAQPSEERRSLLWTTPLGLMVVQPYVQSFTVRGCTNRGLFSQRLPRLPESASMKQATALMPNLIHSLDATHLHLSALRMQREGLVMTGVHDSYWTHAAHMETLARVLREEFVDLYENHDPLVSLLHQWQYVFGLELDMAGVTLPAPPEKGKLNLRLVLDSPYFFS